MAHKLQYQPIELRNCRNRHNTAWWRLEPQNSMESQSVEREAENQWKPTRCSALSQGAAGICTADQNNQYY